MWFLAAVVCCSAFAKDDGGGLTCTVEGITDNCDFFKKNGAREIDMGDGTFIPNYYAGYGASSPTLGLSPKPISGYGSSDGESPYGGYMMYDPAKLEKKRQTVLQAQAALISDSGLTGSSVFKMALTDELTITYLGNAPSMYPGATPRLLIPWPPNSTEFQTVPLDKLKAEYIDKLPAATRQNLILQAEKVLAAQRDLFSAPPEAPVQVALPSYEYCMSAINDAKKCAATAENLPPSPSPQRIAQVIKLAEKVRALLLEEIKGGRPNAQLSSDELFMIQKIEATRFNKTPGESAGCADNLPNGWNDTGIMLVSLCPKTYNLPDEAIIQMIAHEFGHSIDACNLYGNMYELSIKDPKKITLPTDEKIKSSKELKAAVNRLRESAKNKDYIFGRLNIDFPPEVLKQLEDSGLIKPVGRKYSASKQLPYQKAYECLIKETPMREATYAMVDERFKLDARMYRDTYGDRAEDSIKALKREYARNFEQFPQCVKGAQTVEGMADLWASKVMGRYFESKVSPGKTDALKAFGLFLPFACNDLLKGELNEWAAQSDPHSLNRERIELSFFQDARVRKALRCQEPRKNDCASLIGTPLPKTTESGYGSKESVK